MDLGKVELFLNMTLKKWPQTNINIHGGAIDL